MKLFATPEGAGAALPAGRAFAHDCFPGVREAHGARGPTFGDAARELAAAAQH